MVLEQFFGYLLGKRHGAKKAMRELEISLRAKDPVTPVEDTELYSTTMTGNLVFFLTILGSGSLVWFATRKGCAEIFGDMVYFEFYHRSATDILESGEELKKMELAKIILNTHSTDELLVEAVKRHFIAENVLSDQHQEQQLFRWRLRNSYVEYTFMERMKESEANNSDDNEDESSVNTTSFEDDSLACILGPPANNTEINKPPEHTGGTVLTRRELHVHRGSHRHGRRLHADKTAVLS